ncbi:MAG: polyprenyl synthetase family protein [Candidatus Aminicenantes bacterium]|nr:polyprenyl synthetase family protein [Candidatus Aminicenantes bacterium]
MKAGTTVTSAAAEARIAKLRAMVEAELGRVLAREETILYQAMRYAVLGSGKRFRPLLTLAAAEAFGGAAAVRAALPFAVAAELVHSYSLVHDDLPCMDDDDTRRGKLSCHKAFGEDMALLAGDALLTLAFEVMAGAAVPPAGRGRKVKVAAEMARLAGPDGMIGGQVLDITFSAENATPESLFQLMLRKTAALITGAVRAGAIIGGAGPAGLRAATLYGENVGLAFQVRDDLQDAGKAEKAEKARPRPGAAREPNYAALIGRDKAKERLGQLVQGALAALDKGRVRSPLLRHLALSLK